MYVEPGDSVCFKCGNALRSRFVDRLVDKILARIKIADYLGIPARLAQVREYEKQIDRMVYDIYGLTKEEIRIVEGRQ